ncbi:glycosyl transferase family 2 (plasmid) [Gloeothece citriformis PCC 7424]|uniref:Glycosyl transferase family 2 n=1 Tax=Gloeothece citriformis (strain PCC 7424) TaxID=65393 RepID=B7KM23_GLOC7|nr:glycosyltransferase family 2 protein [Gloeothece citriformis]ACK73845.1 glycosyl transferase family 2 [Gloeothece citriformis PCC 7424]
MCLFSVIIPSYNRAKLIEKTLYSVLKQDFQDYEIIIVDDGSTDNTIEILKQYQKFIRILQQENQGPGAARNLGIQQSKGHYIAFLDSDDQWFPWTLATYEKLIYEYQEPSFICGRFINTQIGETEPIFSKTVVNSKHYGDFYDCSEFLFYSFTTSSVVIKKQILRDVQGFSQIRSNYEDMDLWLRLGTAPGFVMIESPLLCIRWFHDHNICLSPVHNRQGIQLIVEAEKQGQYPGGSQRKSDRRAKICALLRVASVTFVREGKIQDAMYIYAQTFVWQLQLGRVRYLVGLPLITLIKIGGQIIDHLFLRKLKFFSGN